MSMVAKPSLKVGRNGRTTLRLLEHPTIANGNVGDSAYVVDAQGRALWAYGPKMPGGWPEPVRVRGMSFIFKTGPLTNSGDGVDGDSAMTLISGVMRFYQKVAGVWGSPVETITLPNATAPHTVIDVTDAQLDSGNYTPLTANNHRPHSVNTTNACNIILPAGLARGHTFEFVRRGTADVTFSAGVGASLQFQVAGHTKIANRYWSVRVHNYATTAGTLWVIGPGTSA